MKRNTSIHNKNKDWHNKAVLVFGPRKSGTTLTQSLLDGGEELLMRPGELKVKFFACEIWNNKKEAHQSFFQERRKLAGFSGFEHDMYLQLVDDSHPESGSLSDLMKVEIDTIYKNIDTPPTNIKYWAAKEAGGNIHRILPFWKSNFFDGKLIFVIRDPLMIVRSIITDGKKHAQYMDWKRIRKEVKTALSCLRRMSSLMNKPYIYTVIYEDLTYSPHDTVDNLCDFLQIKRSEKLYLPTIFGENISVRTSSQEKREVFHSKKKWFEDLTFRERFFVILFYFLHKRVHYKKIVQSAKAGNSKKT